MELMILNEKMHEQNYPECLKLINCIKQLSLNQKKRKSFNSLLIRFNIATENISQVKNLIYSDINLMKRDYLLYCITIYPYNIDESIHVFNTFIKSKEQLLKKDIDKLIEHKCYELLKQLDGYYILCNHKTNIFYENINESTLCSLNLKKYDIMNIRDEIIMYYKNILNKYYEEFIFNLKKVDVILDGCNISYHNHRTLDYKYIIKILKHALQKYKNPLFIIHKRHLKSKCNNIKILKTKYKKYLYTTPYNVYDDYFLILGMIYNNIPVITNDIFRDHVFDMFKLFDTKNNRIKNYISEMILSYNKDEISNKEKYSKCIQCNNNNIYIPAKDGFYCLKY